MAIYALAPVIRAIHLKISLRSRAMPIQLTFRKRADKLAASVDHFGTLTTPRNIYATCRTMGVPVVDYSVRLGERAPLHARE